MAQMIIETVQNPQTLQSPLNSRLHTQRNSKPYRSLKNHLDHSWSQFGRKETEDTQVHIKKAQKNLEKFLVIESRRTPRKHPVTGSNHQRTAFLPVPEIYRKDIIGFMDSIAKCKELLQIEYDLSKEQKSQRTGVMALYFSLNDILVLFLVACKDNNLIDARFLRVAFDKKGGWLAIFYYIWGKLEPKCDLTMYLNLDLHSNLACNPIFEEIHGILKHMDNNNFNLIKHLFRGFQIKSYKSTSKNFSVIIQIFLDISANVLDDPRVDMDESLQMLVEKIKTHFYPSKERIGVASTNLLEPILAYNMVEHICTHCVTKPSKFKFRFFNGSTENEVFYPLENSVMDLSKQVKCLYKNYGRLIQIMSTHQEYNVGRAPIMCFAELYQDFRLRPDETKIISSKRLDAANSAVNFLERINHSIAKGFRCQIYKNKMTREFTKNYIEDILMNLTEI